MNRIKHKIALLILALFPAITFAFTVDIDALETEREQIKIVLAGAKNDWDSNRVEATIISQRVIDLAQSKEQIQKQVEGFKVRLNKFKTDWWNWDADSMAVESDCETAVIMNAGEKTVLTQTQINQCSDQMKPIKVRQAELRNERKHLDLIKENIQSLINSHGRDTRKVNIAMSDLVTSDTELADLNAKMSQRLAEINSILN